MSRKPETGRFQMQCWSGNDDEGELRVWEPMEAGVAPRVWRPRATAREAIDKCRAWTGYIGIPAMQVVDLETGFVVWRDASAYRSAWPSVVFYDEEAPEQLKIGA